MTRSGTRPPAQPRATCVRWRAWAAATALLLLGVPGCAPGPVQPPDATPVPAERAVPTRDVAAVLPERPDLERTPEGVFWIAPGGERWRIARVRPDEWLELEIAEGPLRVHWDHLLAGSEDEPTLAELPRLLAHARSAGLDPAQFTWVADELTGGYLVGAEAFVIGEGVLRPLAVSSPDPAHEAALAELGRAIEAFGRALEGSRLQRPARTALRELVEQLALRDVDQSFDHLPPSVARRLVRHGWPSGAGIDPAAVATLRSAVLAAEALRGVSLHVGADPAGDPIELEQTRDAFGNTVWWLRTAQAVAFSRQAPAPAYYYDTRPLRSVQRYPAVADPRDDASGWRRLEAWRDGRRFAEYDVQGGFDFDPTGWRQALPARDASSPPDTLEDALPPHVVALEPDGDVLALVTQFGVVRPARDGSDAEVERFLAEAARALPDAAHLDLIGEYLVVYAYDSPDLRFPLLLGTREVAGDIHQTVSQTLATQAGGTYRGDCDDLSELYQEIAERQGRTAHLIGLPAHAALAWAEPLPDGGGWQTFVLHTGQPLVFRADTLRQSLELTYKSFGAGEVMDFTKLEVLLRFSGENTRSSWFLSDRIFADPDYARAMIDVQRDWHFVTYQRAIVKMREMIAAGDDDTANWSELSGLYLYTGQYDRAAASMQRAIERTDSLQTQVSIHVDRVLALIRAGRGDAARAQVAELRERILPELEQELGVPVAEPRLSLADALAADDFDPELALEILADEVAPQADEALETFERLAEIAGAAALLGGEVDGMRYSLRWFVASSVSVLHETRSAEDPQALERRRALERRVARWARSLAFVELDPAESLLARYAVVARFRAATDPAFGAALAPGQPLPAAPATAQLDHAARDADAEARERDLAFGASSPHYWSGEVARLFERTRPRLDRRRLAELADRFDRAIARAEALGLDHASFASEIRDVHLVRALVERDEQALRRIFASVRDHNDRRQRLEMSSWIATAARFLPLDWYGRVMELWREELNYKPMYFWIAWTAALADAPQHALVTARLATRAFPDDPAFAQEYAYMRSRFQEQRGARGSVPVDRGATDVELSRR